MVLHMLIILKIHMQVTADVLDLSGDTNFEPLSPFNLEPLALSDQFSERNLPPAKCHCELVHV